MAFALRAAVLGFFVISLLCLSLVRGAVIAPGVLIVVGNVTVKAGYTIPFSTLHVYSDRMVVNGTQIVRTRSSLPLNWTLRRLAPSLAVVEWNQTTPGMVNATFTFVTLVPYVKMVVGSLGDIQNVTGYRVANQTLAMMLNGSGWVYVRAANLNPFMGYWWYRNGVQQSVLTASAAGEVSVNTTFASPVWIAIVPAPSSDVHLYINGTEANRNFALNRTMNLTGTVAPNTLNVTIEFTNGTVIGGPSLGVNTTYVNSSDWGEGIYYLWAHGLANGTYADRYSKILVITIGAYEYQEWSVADYPVNWWLVAYLISTGTILVTLGGGVADSTLRLRLGLLNIFLGVPAGLWMLQVQAGVVNGTVMVLMLSIIYPLAQVGIGVTNIFSGMGWGV